jgi:Fic-DOC domain mobile mystery protein B
MAVWEPIPGETPIDDITGLIAKGIRTRAQLNLVEAENFRRAVLRYLAARPSRRQAPFTLEWCYTLHRQMFGNVWRWAGKRRESEVNIGVPVSRIDIDLQNLLDDLKYWREHKDMCLIEQAARLHHRAVQIHPFLNGNGRWSRLLANIHLKQSRSAVTVWSEEAIGTASVIRQEYLSAIRAADAGDYAPLIQLHERYTKPA